MRADCQKTEQKANSGKLAFRVRFVRIETDPHASN